MRSFLFAAFIAILANKVVALNITVGNLVNISALQFVNFTSLVRGNCNSNCEDAVANVTQCATDACLCGNDTVVAIVECQQCMFKNLIDLNIRFNDPREGQTSALTAYSTACNASLHYPLDMKLTALKTPPEWDGPFGQGLSTFTTVISVIAAAVLGSGLIAVVNTM